MKLVFMQIFLSVKKIVLLLKFGPRGVGVGGGGVVIYVLSKSG